MNDEKIEDMLYRENLQIASLQKRIFAYLLDDMLLTILFMIIFFNAFVNLAGDREAMLRFITDKVLYLFLLKWIYHGLFTYFYGASIGKILLKIRIIQINDLDKPNFLNAMLRSFFRELLSYISFLFAFGDVFARTLHDRIVKTIVITQD